MYKDRPEFKGYNDPKIFKQRLGALRKQVVADKLERAQFDDKALAQDRVLHPAPKHDFRGDLIWRGSKAEEYLSKDIEAGKHKSVSTRNLFLSRPEYQWFNLKFFRKHVCQEINSRKTKNQYSGKKASYNRFYDYADMVNEESDNGSEGTPTNNAI